MSASSIVRSWIRLERETCLFALASALDFLMTWSLLGFQAAADDVEFVESNPVARFFLTNWGLIGLVGFKLAMVCAIAAVAASLVVVYSAGLMIQHS